MFVSVPAFAATKAMLKPEPTKAEANKAPSGTAFQDTAIKSKLLEMFKKEGRDNKHILQIRKEAFAYGGKSIPALIEVMKDGRFPDRNRWAATFLLGQIAGNKASPFISKFMVHPHWIMRMASLKTLLALKQTNYAPLYVKALQDESLVVRGQALENIRHLNLSEHAPHVWAMLYDKRNYYEMKKGNKRANIIKNVIRTIGDLKFEKAKSPMLKMIQKEKYADIYTDLEYSLTKIIGKTPPKGNDKSRKVFWERLAISEKTI
jgi:HEAT repeat protein